MLAYLSVCVQANSPAEPGLGQMWPVGPQCADIRFRSAFLQVISRSLLSVIVISAFVSASLSGSWPHRGGGGSGVSWGPGLGPGQYSTTLFRELLGGLSKLMVIRNAGCGGAGSTGGRRSAAHPCGSQPWGSRGLLYCRGVLMKALSPQSPCPHQRPVVPPLSPAQHTQLEPQSGAPHSLHSHWVLLCGTPSPRPHRLW